LTVCQGSGEITLDLEHWFRFGRGQFKTICAAIAAGEAYLRDQPDHGLFADLISFMERNSLVWPSEPKSDEPPASTLPEVWNVIDFQSGKKRVEISSRNGRLRARWLSLDRELWRFLEDLKTGNADVDKRLSANFCAITAGMELMWDEMQRRCIVSG
jgi:hypothetical protein